MATLFAKIKIFSGKEAAFEDVCRQLHAETMTEPGCQLYAYWRSQEERTYYCLLVFNSYADFLIHQVSDHHEKLITPRSAELFEDFSTEWLDPVSGAGLGPATEHQPAKPEDSDGKKTYAKMMPAIVADWWQVLRNAA